MSREMFNLETFDFLKILRFPQKLQLRNTDKNLWHFSRKLIYIFAKIIGNVFDSGKKLRQKLQNRSEQVFPIVFGQN